MVCLCLWLFYPVASPNVPNWKKNASVSFLPFIIIGTFCLYALRPAESGGVSFGLHEIHKRQIYVVFVWWVIVFLSNTDWKIIPLCREISDALFYYTYINNNNDIVRNNEKPNYSSMNLKYMVPNASNIQMLKRIESLRRRASTKNRITDLR